MGMIVTVFLWIAILWLAFKVGRLFLKVGAFILALIIGLFVIGMVLGTLGIVV